LLEGALLAGQPVFISIAAVAEILAGMRPSEEEDTEALLALFSIFPADETLARIAGAYLNQYAASHGLDLGDAITAATAKVIGSELYTPTCAITQ
jgi:predicted nucleic acid-binding protein